MDYLITEAGVKIQADDSTDGIDGISGTEPGIPRNFNVAGGTNRIIAIWQSIQDSDGNEVAGIEYDLEYRVGNTGVFTRVRITITSLSIRLLSPGVYQVRLAAVNSVGRGLYTAIEIATVTPPATVPDAPASLTLTGGQAQFTAEWTASLNADDFGITGYDVNYRVGNTGSFTSVKVTGLTTTITGLTAGAYQVKVAAINSIGTGAFINIKFSNGHTTRDRARCPDRSNVSRGFV